MVSPSFVSSFSKDLIPPSSVVLATWLQAFGLRCFHFVENPFQIEFLEPTEPEFQSDFREVFSQNRVILGKLSLYLLWATASHSPAEVSCTYDFLATHKDWSSPFSLNNPTAHSRYCYAPLMFLHKLQHHKLSFLGQCLSVLTACT
jgi:hypothetical protein